MVQLATEVTVFFFFSNRLGCLPSILISVAVTAVIIFLLRAF